jgi:short-subunit dehydrogenase
LNATALKRIVIIGASSGIAQQCARLWVEEGPKIVVLVGRDLVRLESIAADLKVRSSACEISCLTGDFENPAAIGQLVDGICASGSIDIVLIAHGSLPEQLLLQQDLAACASALSVNGVSPVLFAEAFAGHMQQQGYGSLALIGSVAGDRGRRSNYVYGAAKGLVTRYAQGLQHRFAGSAVKVLLIKPGPTDTPMTAQMKQKGVKLASASEVAERIVGAVKAGDSVVYAPPKWAVIMMIIRHLPRFIFNKMNI